MGTQSETVKVKMASVAPLMRAEGEDVMHSQFDLMLMTEDGVDVRFTLDVVAVTILEMGLHTVLRSILNEAKAAHPEAFNRPNPFEGMGGLGE